MDTNTGTEEEKEKKRKLQWQAGNMWGIVGIFFLLLVASRFGSYNGMKGSEIVTGRPLAQSSSTKPNIVVEHTVENFDPRDATYVIDGVKITLTDGLSEQPIPGSSAKIIVRYFGNGAFGDLNEDGKPDMAYYLTVETGGTGMFYYTVAAINAGYANPLSIADLGAGSYRVTNSVLIGDRIASQPSEIRAGKLYIQYADRKAGEPMSAVPSVAKTRVLDVNSQNVLRE